MRFGLLLYRQITWPDDCGGSDGQPNYATSYGFNLGVTVPAPQCGFPNVDVSGFNNLGTQATQGGPQNNKWSVWSGQDSVSYTRGKHLFKFGGEIHDTRFIGQRSITNIDGTFTFNSSEALPGIASVTPLENFLGGLPTTATILAGSDSYTLNTWNWYALFAQDDWRLTPRVTLNLGLRWEYIQPSETPDNEMANFNPSSPSGFVQETNGGPVFRDQKNEFQPRLGVAWDVTGKGTTLLRAGAGYMYSVPPLAGFPTLLTLPTGFAIYQPNGTLLTPQPGTNVNGSLQFNGTSNPSTTPIPWQSGVPAITLTPNSVNSSGLAIGNGLGRVNPALPTSGTNPGNPTPANITPTPLYEVFPLLLEWNVSLQHAFGNNLSLNVAYVGNRAYHVAGISDINLPTPGVKNGTTSPTNENELLRRPFTADCPISEGGQGLGGPCFPWLNQVNEDVNNDFSTYEALQATLQKRVSHGLTFLAGYTYGHALDTASSTALTEQGNNPRGDYGNATFDARHHFTFTGTYDIPGIKSPGQILQGWQANVVLLLMSGLPYNADDTTDDLSGTGINLDRWNILGDADNIKGGTASSIPCFGVPGSTFATNGACTIVAAGTSTKGTPAFVTNMPSQCVAAAETNSVSNGGLWNVSSNSSVPSPSNLLGSASADRAYNALASLGTFGCYYQNGTAIVPSAQGTYGDMGRDVLTGHTFRETDLSITKTWKFKERMTAQFRAEFFNIWNAVEYAPPAGNLASPSTFGASATTPNLLSLIFGNGSPREVQLGLKLIF